MKKVVYAFILNITILIFSNCANANLACTEVLASSKNANKEKSYAGQIVVLDTNILIQDPEAIAKFPGADIYIHVAVLSELDRQKEDKSRPELQYRARQVARFMRDLADSNGGSLAGAIPVGVNSRLHFFRESLTEFIPEGFDPEKNDNLIVGTALALQEKFPDKKVIFVSNDLNPSHLANIFGIQTLELARAKIASEDKNLFSGFTELSVTDSDIEIFKREGQITIEREFSPNQYVLLKSHGPKGEPTQSVITRYDAKFKKALVPLSPLPSSTLPIDPNNIEQQIALDLLLNPDIKLVTLVGAAGTGKTLLAIAAGIYQTMWSQSPVYESVIITRPTVVVGEEQGFLPGSDKKKVEPYLRPFYDNIEFLVKLIQRNNWKPNEPDNLNQKAGSIRLNDILKKVEIINLAYIRGNSIRDRLIIVDEAQNLTSHEIKTIVTRAGEGTKIVLIGDLGQIDNRALNSRTNGLAIAVNLFREVAIAGHVSLVTGERSELATIAVELFQ